MNLWIPMADVLKPAKKGTAELRCFEVDELAAERSKTREVATRGREPAITAGCYVQLRINGELVMSDTPMEKDTNEDFVRWARGDVLIAGLGLGMVVLPLIRRAGVLSVTVIEKSQDVIDLVLPQLLAAVTPEEAAKLTVLRDDINTWKPPRRRWDYIYFDIWPGISRDNLPEMRALHRRFRPKLRKHGTVTSWLFEELAGGWL